MKAIKIIPLLFLTLIFIGFLGRCFFYQERKESLLKPIQHGVQLAWPSTGEAAIGTVEDGLLALSSGKEKLRATASMAKVITALAIMKKQPFSPGQEGLTFTITRNDITNLNAYISEGGSVLPIVIGMKLTQHQAMQRMLMASDNNMADILAERIFGSIESYISFAQDMLRSMGLTRTVVADASGFSSATVSTPSELVAIGIAALKDPVIARIVQQKQVQTPVAGLIKNTNLLLGMDGIIGIKTGTTDKAGSCLLFAARYAAKDGRKGTLVGVVMGDKNHSSVFKDTRDLLLSAKQGFGFTGPQPKEKPVMHSPKQKSLKPKQ